MGRRRTKSASEACGEDALKLLVHRVAIAACVEPIERAFKMADRRLRKSRRSGVNDVEELIDQMEASE